MIFAEEDLNSLNAIAGLLASFGCDSQAGCVLYIQHKIIILFHVIVKCNIKGGGD